MLKLGSLFDGSGGFPLAGSLYGIEPVWASEVEPYPIAVTRSRFPKMKHFGDISKINGAEVELVDIITFGSPCQDLSVAGKRAGLKHEANGDDETTRSGLFMEAVRIIKEMREATNGEYPSFALWENVPGAFSSNKGEDFRIVLEELIKIVEPTAVMPEVPKGGWAYADSYFGDGWSLSYRVFDAQYWGVPQRRRRIHLVLDLRGERAQEVLFEREGVRGYFATGGAPGQGASADAERSLGADDREGADVSTLTPWDSQGNQVHDGTGNNVFPCLRGCGGAGYQAGYVLAEAVGLDGYNATTTGEVSATLGVNCGMSTGRNGVITFEPGIDAREGAHIYEGVAYPVEAGGFCPEQSVKTRGIGWEEEMSPTLRAGVTPAVVCKTWDAPDNEDGDICNTITGDHVNRITDNTAVVVEPTPNVIDVEMEVAVRKYEVDTDRLSALLRSHKGNRTNREIAEALNQPVTMVEHWFRTDNCFAIPDADIWVDLKKLLGIETTEFDQCITEYEFKGGNYDMRNRIYAGAVAPTLTVGCGNHLHLVSEPVYCLQGNGIDRADTAGCNGRGWNDETCYTLNTIDRPAVCYTLSHGGFMVNPSCDGVADTLQATDYKDPQVIAIDRAAFNQGQNAQYDPQFYEDGTVSTLVARGPSAVCFWDGSQTCGTLTANNAGGNQRMPDKENFNCVLEKQEIRYIVRRLTPTECARLQGFPDTWGHIGTKEDLTDDEWTFWAGVRNTHADINGKVVKSYTKAQMLTWYNKLHTDSAEYKMWGNGIALPPALYCMQGIVEAMRV